MARQVVSCETAKCLQGIQQARYLTGTVGSILRTSVVGMKGRQLLLNWGRWGLHLFSLETRAPKLPYGNELEAGSSGGVSLCGCESAAICDTMRLFCE